MTPTTHDKESLRCAFRLGHTDGYPRKAVEGGKVFAPEIDPNRLSAEAGVSIYDIFMHLNPMLPRVVV